MSPPCPASDFFTHKLPNIKRVSKVALNTQNDDLMREGLKLKRISTLLVICAALLIGCSEPSLNLPQTRRYVVDDPALGIEYTFSLILGERDGQRFSLMGRTHPVLQVAFVVRDVLTPKSDIRGLEIYLWNFSKDPKLIYAGQFELISPTGQRYTFDSAQPISVTLQPDERVYVKVFFRTGNRDLTEPGWRLAFTANTGGLFSTPVTSYVWAIPAYRTEPL